MKHLLALLTVTTGAFPLLAEDGPLDATYLRTHALTRGFMLGRPTRPQPTPDGKAVLFLRSDGPRSSRLALHEFDTATGKCQVLLSPERLLKGTAEKLTPEEKARRERMRITAGGFTDFQLSADGSQVLTMLSGRLFLFERTKGTVRELKTGAGTLQDPKFSPDAKKVAYVRNFDVAVYDLAADRETSITTGGSAKLTHGLAEFVAQEEMSRFSGMWWSPDSRLIVYEEANADGVETWHVADPARPESAGHPTFYPRPGMANVQVRLGVIPVRGGTTVWIQWDEKKYPYLAQVRWDKHGPLGVTVQTRDQKELVLLQADPKTGQTTPLVAETDPTWVPLHQDGPLWFADGTFVRTGEPRSKPGGPRLEHRSADGKLLKVLAGRKEGYQGLVAVEPNSRRVFFRASLDPTQSLLFARSVGSDKLLSLTGEPGIHGAAFSEDHSVYVIHRQSSSAMPQTTVHKANGDRIGELPSVALDPPFQPRFELVKIGADPGFYASIVRPRNFDEKKKYPVLVDVYGGPGHNRVLMPMNTRLLDQWLADQGFVVVSIDNRGTPGRGRDWERAVYQKFGTVPLEDQVAGLEALTRRFPEMDRERIGIVGWSFGGYLSALAVLRRPDVFKAAVAGAPVTDWLDYDTHYTERYLGVPAKKDDPAYREASLLTYAKDLKRPLLLIHGTADDNVYFRHTLRLADVLFREGKEFDLLPLAGLTHMVPDPVVMERLWTRIARHFQKHLGAPAPR